ncbi:MAG: endonuclease/exonuclease/phosphatase family protein [Actinomycetota bacterium]
MLKVLTLNLWNRSGPYKRRKPRIREWISKLDPDVIGFQEAMSGEGFDQVGELLDGLDYEIDLGVASQWDGTDFGNAIASRWPIGDREVLMLPTSDTDETRCALSVTIDAPFGDLSFTCTHLNWKFHHGMVREQQVVPLVDMVLRRRPREAFPPILVGDFNANPESTEIRFVTGLHALSGRSAYFYDAWAVAGDGEPGYTWSNRNAYAAIALEPDRRIDYIFTGYPIRIAENFGIGKIEKCRVVCDDEVDGVWPSDHFGLYAELRTEPLPRPEWTMS